MGFLRQEYWNGLPFPPPGELPDPGIEPKSSASPALQANSLHWATREAHIRSAVPKQTDHCVSPLGFNGIRGQSGGELELQGFIHL